MRILDNLQDWERLTVADALESVCFEKGEDIGMICFKPFFQFYIAFFNSKLLISQTSRVLKTTEQCVKVMLETNFLSSLKAVRILQRSQRLALRKLAS